MATHFFVSRPPSPEAHRLSIVLPDAACRGVLQSLDGFARMLVRMRISANAITSFCIGLGAVAGALVAFGVFGWATLALVIASLGDAVDGMVARRGGSVSVGGALLDASGDRYQEFFFFAGLALCVHQSMGALAIVLLAIAGSYMVSYSSAKAEALGVPVPPGVMRRPERAVCLCVGSAAMTPWPWLVAHYGLPRWLDHAPIMAVAGLIAIFANGSAIRRLHMISSSFKKPEVPRKVAAPVAAAGAATPSAPAPVAAAGAATPSAPATAQGQGLHHPTADRAGAARWGGW
jgi:phosphatidylglycerophosphate synthase